MQQNNNDAQPVNMTIAGGTMDRPFSASETQYAVAVQNAPSITVTATVTLPQGATVGAGSTSHTGFNNIYNFSATVTPGNLTETITIVIRAQSGVINTITITVNMLPPA